MAKKKTDKPKKPRVRTPKTGRINARKVQATENTPPPAVPAVEVRREVDEDPLDALGLTPRQRAFVTFYCGTASFNATRAAELAGYRSDNYHALRSTASEVCNLPKVQDAIARRMAQMELDPDNLKNGIAAVAQSSMANFLTRQPDGQYKLDLDRAAKIGALGQIKEIKEKVVESSNAFVVVERTVKVHDPIPARMALAKLTGLLVDKVDLTSGGKPIKGYADVDDGDTTED